MKKIKNPGAGHGPVQPINGSAPACLRLSCVVDGEKSQVVLRLSKHYSSVIGQDQALFF
jgi:hypothetical protein